MIHTHPGPWLTRFLKKFVFDFAEIFDHEVRQCFSGVQIWVRIMKKIVWIEVGNLVTDSLYCKFYICAAMANSMKSTLGRIQNTVVREKAHREEREKMGQLKFLFKKCPGKLCKKYFWTFFILSLTAETNGSDAKPKRKQLCQLLQQLQLTAFREVHIIEKLPLCSTLV